MRRAYVSPAALVVNGGVIALPSDVSHRFARVLRLADGEPVELFDGTGRVARGTLAASGSTLVDVVLDTIGDGLPPLVLAQAAVATDKLELVVQKATELGASHVCVFDAARSQIHLKADRLEKRQARLQRIAEDAARQSGRASVPAVSWLASTVALSTSPLWRERVAARAAIVVGAVDAPTPLSEVLAQHSDVLDVGTGGALVTVGPEGGLDAGEIKALVAAGAQPVRLGAHVLRTETAGLVALAAVQARLGLL